MTDLPRRERRRKAANQPVIVRTVIGAGFVVELLSGDTEIRLSILDAQGRWQSTVFPAHLKEQAARELLNRELLRMAPAGNSRERPI